MLRNGQRALFLEKLEDAVEGSGVRPFQVHVTGLDWVPNSDRTRWFLVLKLKGPETDGLNTLLAVTNCVARDSGLEMLYTGQEPQEDGLLEKESCMGGSGAGKKGLNRGKHKEFSAIVPADRTSRFHSSIAWQLEQPDKESLGSETALKSVGCLSISCDCLKVKIGNAIHDIPLTQRRLSEQALGRI
jgi:U6 snRNA phosphodiesterase